MTDTRTDHTTITAYPLSWPAGWQRTRNPRRSAYGDRSLAVAREAITREVRLLGGTALIISSNLELRLDGLPRSGQRQPNDRGVAIYFKYKRKPVSFANDRWNSVEDNLWAISLALSAIRQIERTGASEMLDRAFAGFDALPAPGETSGESWWDVLGVSSQANLDEIKAAYRSLARQHHPDVGGDPAEFDRVTRAYKTAIGED
jgi:hypothetical protein